MAQYVMDAITTKCANIKLSEKERSEVDLAPPGVDQGLVIAGKFYTKRRVNLEAIGRALRSVWRTKQDFEVSDLGENRVLFSFQIKEDLDRVLLQGPWSFDKYILLLHKLKVGETVSSLTFHEATFWVQIHGLPTLSQTRDAGLSIGGILGKVEKVDVGDNGVNLGCFLRIRVTLDISQPLIRGRMVRMGGSDSRWVEFKYERLPVFCYLCGRLDHDEKECIEWIRRAVPLKAEDKQYGPWLRAIPNRLQKTHMVTGMQAGERAKTGQMGSERADGVKQSDKQAGTSVECRQPKGDEETNGKRVDVESLILQNEKFKKKLTKEMEKSVFEEQLREIDAEIFSKADREGNVQMAPKVRILESEKMVPANREEEVRNDGPVHDMGIGPSSSGPQEEMGFSKDLLGPAGINVPLDPREWKTRFPWWAEATSCKGGWDN